MARNRRKIYVLMTFSTHQHPKDNSLEIKNVGVKYWFRNEKYALEYLENAGKVSSNGLKYEDPFEHCWPYAVIEEVFEGPCPPPGKVIGWWKCNWNDNKNIISVDKLDKPPIDGAELSYGFTQIGC